MAENKKTPWQIKPKPKNEVAYKIKTCRKRNITSFIFPSKNVEASGDFPYHESVCQNIHKNLAVCSKTLQRRRKRRKQEVVDDVGVYVMNVISEVTALPCLVAISPVKVKICQFVK